MDEERAGDTIDRVENAKMGRRDVTRVCGGYRGVELCDAKRACTMAMTSDRENEERREEVRERPGREGAVGLS